MRSIHGPTVQLAGCHPGSALSLIGREVEVAMSRFAEDNRENRCVYEPGVLA
jgi:hypothetical protein